MNINISEPWFSYILNGQKTIEGRLRKGKFAELKPGDKITINNQLSKTVKKITRYDSFLNMILLEGIDKVLPGIDTVDEGVQVYRQIYTKEMEETYSVIAIEII
jgi:ASC-1-like (ASCH) protein